MVRHVRHISRSSNLSVRDRVARVRLSDPQTALISLSLAF